MYRYKKSNHQKLRNFMTIIGIIILTSILTILLYRLYIGIDINTYGTRK